MELSTDALTPEKSSQLAAEAYQQQQAKVDPMVAEMEKYKQQKRQQIEQQLQLQQ